MARVLVACEFSGVVREAFRAVDIEAWSCDLLPALDDSPYHIQGDVLKILDKGWDLMIAHPPCTYLCSSGLHWNKKRPGRAQKTEEALQFVETLMAAPIKRIAIENPIGCISSRIRLCDQIIQPYQFGDDASKSTCLWLKNLPMLRGTNYIPPRTTRRILDKTNSHPLKIGGLFDQLLTPASLWQWLCSGDGEEFYNETIP